MSACTRVWARDSYISIYGLTCSQNLSVYSERETDILSASALFPAFVSSGLPMRTCTEKLLNMRLCLPQFLETLSEPIQK